MVFSSRSAMVLMLGLMLVACTTQPQALGPSPVPPTPLPTLVASLTPDPPTPTPVAQPTARPTPTRTASPTATARRAVTATPRFPTKVIPSPSAHRYVFPIRSSGQVHYGKAHHDYPATDIFCPIGSEYLAVTSGVVEYVSRTDRWDPATDDGALRGGISVSMIGDDGVRYYGSHLSQVAEGIAPQVRVSVGQVLGLTGHSGDAASTPPHLHFGISHPTTPDDWQVRRGEINPYPYLRAWQRGESLAPKLP